MRSLCQEFWNLLSNAAKFTSNGTITLAASVDADHFQFVVTDTGIGMTAEQVSKLFQAFSQAETTTAAKYGGTGLGLALSRRLCEVMGGTLTLQSEFGKGSTFTARLPR